MNLHEAEMLNFILTAKWRCYIKQSGHCEEKEKNVNKKGNASRYLFSSCIMYLHEAEMQNEDVTIFSKADNTQKKKKKIVSFNEFVERKLRLSGECSLPVTRPSGHPCFGPVVSLCGYFCDRSRSCVTESSAQRSTYVHSRLESAPLASVSIYLFTAVKPLLMDWQRWDFTSSLPHRNTSMKLARKCVQCTEKTALY